MAITQAARGETPVSHGWSLVAPGASADLCAQLTAPGIIVFGQSNSGAYNNCARGAMRGEPGRGYWVYAEAEASLAMPPAAADRPVSITLKKGWNLIGNPFGAELPWNGQVRVNGVPIAELDNFLSLPYEYMTATGGYRTVQVLLPGKGYAIHANDDCTLILPLPDGTGQGITFEPVAASQIVTDPEMGDYVGGQVVALRAAGVSDAEARSRAAALGYAVAGYNSYLGLYQITLPAGANEQQAAATLIATAEFESASRNRTLKPGAFVPNDPPYQGGPADQRWGFERIKAPQAWTATPPAGPAIAVIDTGVDAAHADLSGKLANGADFIAAGGDGAIDPSGHGTHVAGIIAARGDNAAGMAGVCWGCGIMPVRVCDAGACPFFSVLNGITHAANNGARVINISLETTALPGSPEWNIFQNVVDYAVSNGAFVVAAAGNNGYNENTLPAALKGVFGASAVDKTDYPASFANTSSVVDIFAPGVSIYSLEPGGAEGMRDGTSMSAAFVSGAAGLLSALSPTISNAEIEKTLRDTSDALILIPKDRAGRLNLGAAAAVFGTPNSAPVIVALTLSSQDVNPGQTVNINVKASDPDGDALGYTWTISGGALSSATTTDTVWTAPATPGEYVITVTVSDGKGGNATARGIVRSGLAGLNFMRIYPSVTTLKRGDIVQFQSFGYFNDGLMRPVQPHWELKNGLGVMSADGKFTATETGDETVSATLGRLSAQLSIGIETGGLPASALSPAAMTDTPTAINLTNAFYMVIGTLDGGMPPNATKDFVAINGNGTPSIVHLNSGAFIYNQSNTPDNLYGYMAALGDLDADKDLDLVIAAQDPNPGSPTAGVYVYRNNGAGVFTRITILRPAVNIFSVDIRDMDNNATLDIVAGVGAGTGKPMIFWNTGTGNIATSISDGNNLTINTSACPTASVAVGDINNDSYADIVRVCSTASAEYALNTKNQTFGAGAAIAGSSLASMYGMLADVDADDDLDYVALRNTGAVEGFAIFKNTNPAGPAFGAPDTSAPTWPIGSGSTNFDMADNGNNNDGNLDIFSAPFNATTNANIYFNNGSGAFAPAGGGFAVNARAIVTGDLGGNAGSPDVLVAQDNDSVWSNDADNSAAVPAPTNLTHDVGEDVIHFEWDWAQGAETTPSSLVTFDIEISYLNGGVTKTLNSSINPERLGEIGHATRTVNTFGYALSRDAIPTSADSVTWKVYAVDNMFKRSAASTSDVIGCPEVSSLADSGFATLRDCIDYANGLGAPVTITFHQSITGGTINLISELPEIVSPDITIDGTGSNITLNGTGCAGCSGLKINGSNTTIKGLTISGFPNHGIYLDSAAVSSHIGGDRNVGGGEGNTIISNGQAGIYLHNVNSIFVYGNNIGTKTGTDLLGNLHGIWLTEDIASTFVVSNSIGDNDFTPGVDRRNIIAFNTNAGVYLSGSTPSGKLYQNTLNDNSIYSNGGKGIRIDNNEHGNIQPPQITGVACGSGTDLYNVTVTYANTYNEKALFYFYRADNISPAVAADASGEGYKYLATATGTMGVSPPNIIDVFTDIPFDSSNGQYLTAYRYNNGNPNPPGFNGQGFSEFGNSYDMWTPALLACNLTCPGWTVTNNADSGNGSLRACIDLANSTAGAQTITFNGSYTITPVTELPALTDATGGTTIDGGLNTIKIDGQGIRAFDGIQIESATNTIKNLTIINFSVNTTDAGIRMTTAGAHGNTVIGCKIGTQGMSYDANSVGVVVTNGAHDNLIGGDTAAERNVISGNNIFGIYINATKSNMITGNYIGLDNAGTGSVANGEQGIKLYNGANNNQIGGTTAGEGNYISGNGLNAEYSGIMIETSNDNAIYGNVIGLDINGNALPNEIGIWLAQGAQYNIIGGSTDAKRNVISGNQSYGIRLRDSGTSYNQIKGNYIGTDISGMAALALPLGSGIHIEYRPSYNVIGGPGAGEGNVISGNGKYGVSIDSAFFQPTSYNVVQGNIIGLNKQKTAALKNIEYGVFISSSATTTDNLIGGDITTDYNIIAGNGKGGVGIDQPGADNNMVWGNYIGVLPDKTTYFPNGEDGVRISNGAQGNSIGSDTNTSYGNVIAGNTWDGVRVKDAGTDSNLIASNIIFNNSDYGIELDGADNNMVWGNYVGVLPDRITYIPNGKDGVFIGNGAQGNSIGSDTNTLYGNVIAGNTLDGVRVKDAGTDFNKIARNSIYENGGRGIELDTNGNQNIPYPDITLNSFLGGSSYTVSGTSSCFPGCTVELFKVKITAPATTDYSDMSTTPSRGEAYEYIGATTTDAAGNWEFNPVTINDTEIITATVTDTNGNTSEFAENENLNALAPPCPGWQVTTTADSGAGSLRECITEANSTAGFETITFAVAGTITLASSLPSINDATGDGVTIDGNDTVIISGGGVVSDGFTIESASNTIVDLVIGNFASAAITIKGAAAADNLILSNYIGINTASTAMPNAYGVVIAQGADNNTIGGIITTDANYISGNTTGAGIGVLVADTGTTGNKIYGNYIGSNVGVTAKVANNVGVKVQNGAADTSIGADIANYGNVIGGSNTNGIVLEGAGATGIYGNRVGSNIAGAIDLGNTENGILISAGSTGVTVGGDTSTERNIIANNGGDGIEINNSSGAQIHGNYIGTYDAVTPVPNDGNGIYVWNNSNNNIIGGAAAPMGANIIAFNIGEGVVIDGAGGASNKLSQNRIYSNSGGLGINLTNGGNQNIMPPSITDVRDMGGSIYDMDVTIPAATCSAVSPCKLELFLTNHTQPVFVSSDAGGGEAFLYAGASYTVNSSGPITWAGIDLSNPAFDDSDTVTVTITDNAGNTSEFSNNKQLIATSCRRVSVNTDAVPAPPGSLRDCINRANSTGGTYKTIIFDNALAGQTINLVAGLPAISVSGVTIKNTTGGEIKIKGAGGAMSCLNATTPNGGPSVTGIEIEGLTFINCQYGIRFSDANDLDGYNMQNVLIRNNYVGVDWNNNTGVGYANTFGVYLRGVENSIIDNNVISGNTSKGLWLEVFANNNEISNNHIGTNFAGDAALPNDIGLEISNNIQGCTVRDNVISGNTQYGITIKSNQTFNHVVKGNKIGTNEAGNAALPNGTGLFIGGAAKGIRVGGTANGEGNLISGNTSRGIWLSLTGDFGNPNTIYGNNIGTDVNGDCAAGLGNGGSGIYMNNSTIYSKIGGTGLDEPNTIACNGSDGITISDATSNNNLMRGNILFNNTDLAIDLENGSNSNIAAPVIKAVEFSGPATVYATGTACAGCIVDLYWADNINPPGPGPGITPDAAGEAYSYIDTVTTSATGTWVKWNIPVTAQANYITANATKAANPIDSSSEFANNRPPNTCPVVSDLSSSGYNTLRDCITQANNNGVPVTIEFDAAIANGTISPATQLPAITADFVIVDGTTQNITIDGTGCANCDGLVLGGSDGGVKNLTAVNFDDSGRCGVYIYGSNNTVTGNKLGNNGTNALANDMGVCFDTTGANNTIGGTAAAHANIISGNVTAGVGMKDAGVTGNKIIGNYIGVNSAGTAIANGDGVIMISGANGNVIGGNLAGEPNTIARNTNAGVTVDGAATIQNKISQNKIYENTNAPGIVLSNSGNINIAAPTLTLTTKTGASSYNVWGTTAGCAAPCTVELFRVDDTVAGVGQDATLAGEAYAYLSSQTTTATGSFAFWGADISGGAYFTATVTDTNGNTSEFALNIEAKNDPPVVTSVTFDNGSGLPWVPPDAVTQVTIIVTATDPNGLADLDYAEIDMSPVNAGLGIVLLYDTGVAGAGAANDGIFAGVATAAVGMAPATYTITATVYDDWAASDTGTGALRVTNEPPEVTNAKATPSVVLRDQAGVIFSADVWDNNGLGDIVSVTIDLTPITGPGSLVLNNMGAGYYETAGYTIPGGAPFGNYVLTVTATDAAGATGTATFTLNIGGPPVVNQVTFTPSSLPPDGTTSSLIEVYVDDPDGVADITAVGINLSVVNTTLGFLPLVDSGVYVAGLGQKYTGSVTVDVGTAAATYTITAYATDSKSLTDSNTGDLNVQNVPPVVVFATATPYKVIAGYAPVAFYADVTDGNGLADITSVTINLTTLTGSASLTLYDNGTNGDITAADGRFSFSPYTIPLTATTGIKILTVTAEDAAAATGDATTSIYVSGGPVINQITFTPPTLPPDGVTSSLIEVYVDDPDGPADIAAVSINLTPVNAGLGIIALVDSGTYVPGLGEKYTGTVIVDAGTTAATYTLTASATDTTSLNDTGTGDLGVENDPPVIIFATATPYNVIPGYTPVAIYADVTDNNGLADIDSVTVNLTTISGPAAFTLYDDGTNGDVTANDGRYTFTTYTIPAAAAYGVKALVFTADDGTDTDTESVNIRINTPMTIVSMSFSPDTIAADGVMTTGLTIDIRDVDARSDFDGNVVVDLSSIGAIPGIQSLSFSGLVVGADTYRYTLANIKPQAGWPLGTYNPLATVTDIFGRQASASDGLTLTNMRPKPPVLQAVTAANSAVDIRWTSPYLNTDNTPLANLAGHNLYRRSYSGAYGAQIYVDATTATNTLILYNDNTVTDFETYCYRATAFNSSGLESDPSSEMCVTVYPKPYIFQRVCGDQKTGQFKPPSTPGFFNRPTDITTDDDGNIFVADTDNHRIQKFDKFCVFKGVRGGFGNTPGKFKSPTGITFNPVDKQLYVVDQYNRVQVFDTSDNLTVMPGQFTVNLPISITANPVDGTLYISVNSFNLVTHYTAAGGFIEQWSIPEPRGSDVDSAGNVYVASYTGNAIYKISGGVPSVYLSGGGTGLRQFAGPYDVAIDRADDTMFIADTGNNRIDVYDSSGNLINIIGSYGNNYGFMIAPTGVHVSPFGSLTPVSTLLVVDKMNNRVQEFGPPLP